MSCPTKIDFDCPTRIGDTFTGHKYEFTFDPEEPAIDDLAVDFFDRYDGKVESLAYTVENGGLIRTGDAWEMQPRIITGISPGEYTYKVRVGYDNGNFETLFEGSKTFTR